MNTRAIPRKRIVKPVRFVFATTVCILLFVFIFGSIFGIFDSSAATLKTYVCVEIEEGDTLWDLAKEYGPKDQDIRQTIYDICKFNGVSASTLRPGQIISIPTV